MPRRTDPAERCKRLQGIITDPAALVNGGGGRETLLWGIWQSGRSRGDGGAMGAPNPACRQGLAMAFERARSGRGGGGGWAAQGDKVRRAPTRGAPTGWGERRDGMGMGSAARMAGQSHGLAGTRVKDVMPRWGGVSGRKGGAGRQSQAGVRAMVRRQGGYCGTGWGIMAALCGRTRRYGARGGR
jgi:hypothetical protein